MKRNNSIVTSIFFLEEFLLWRPGEVNTLFQKLFYIIFRSIDSSFPYREIATLINPLLCYILFALSILNVVVFFKSVFNERARADILIWLERNKYIRVILMALFVLIFIAQVLKVLDDSSLTVMVLYQDKGFWTSIFLYMFIKRLLSEKHWE